jgi:hypothetical protein
MPSAAEIAERIRVNDEDRIAKRADAAGRVAELAGQADDARAKLDALTRELGAAVAAAAEVLSLEELAGFIERGSGEVNEWARTGGLREDRLIRAGRKRGGKQGGSARSRSHKSKSARGATAGDTTASDPPGAADASHDDPGTTGPEQTEPAGSAIGVGDNSGAAMAGSGAEHPAPAV